MRIGEFIGQMINVLVETLIREIFKKDFFYDKEKVKDPQGTDANIPTFCPLNYAEKAQTKNFSITEFYSKDGNQVPKAIRGNVQLLMEQLEVIREHFNGAKITVTSGYRSPEHNKKVDGARRSRHMCGQAADIKISGVSPKKVQQGILNLMKSGKIIDGGLGSYPSFTHYDTGPSRRWTEKNRKFWNY